MFEISREARYIVLMALGAWVGAIFYYVFFIEQSADFGRFFDDGVTVVLLADLFVSSLALWSWAAVEGPRLGIRRWWWVIPATLLVGLCFALPLFLYWRRQALEAGG